MKTWLLAFLLVPGLAWADGGVIVSRQTLDGLNLTVMAAPAPLRAGPVDVSVLLQDEKTGDSVLDAKVELAWNSASSTSPDWMPPCCSMEKAGEKIPADRAHSQNKLFYSAMVPVKSAGTSQLLVSIEHGGATTLAACDITVGPPAPPFLAYWMWLAFPPVAIGGFILHQRLTVSGASSRLRKS